MEKHCNSCGAPLNSDFKGNSELYCKYCSTEAGKLKSKEEVKIGIAQWLKSIDETVSETESMKRAEFYMKAMPAWA